MDRPTIKNKDIDDIDFEENQNDMDKKDVCEDCGNYKTNRKEKWCNSCKYVNG